MPDLDFWVGHVPDRTLGSGAVGDSMLVTDADAVLERLVAAIDAEGLGAYGAHVLVGGTEAQHRWRSDDRVNVFSVSKGVSALAAGIAIDDGLVRVDTTVGEALPHLVVADGVERVTLLDLLTMTSGIDLVWFDGMPTPPHDLAQEAVGRPLRDPGVFRYSDASTYLAMRIVGAAVGDVRDWLVPRLFDPLGIDNPQWHRCRDGHIVGGSALHLRTEELARLGRLLRDRGTWRGDRLVDAAWIDRMHAHWIDAGGDGGYAQFGVSTWNGPGAAWRLHGAHGQFVVVAPDADAVVTITAHEEGRDIRLAELAVAALPA